MTHPTDDLATSDELIELVQRSVRQVAEEEGVGPLGDVDGETVLFGPGGLFDSLGIVSLVLAVEEAVEDRFDVAITLADQRAMAQSTSPFRTVGLLSRYVERLVGEEG